MLKIVAFNDITFADALKNEDTDIAAVRDKSHFDYFIEYLGYLHTQYMVIEEQYISKDYLHDYASYYALCFKNYSKYCKRIHFFNTSLTEDIVQKALLDKLEWPPGDFWEHYLGFMVVKPIPNTVIGLTVLKNYNSVNSLSDRNFWGLRKYHVHFFGKKIKLESLAFQEQDSVLAACATTAIWTMLHKASLDFHTVLKSPNQITKDAGNVAPDGSRLFPNKGLDVSQICQAILNSGLVTELVQPDLPPEDLDNGPYVSNAFTKNIINAYSLLGIPIILVIEVPGQEKNGGHAIAVSGYKQLPVAALDPDPEIRLVANNIEKLYAHDDQFGPFVRVTFKNECDLVTKWTECDPEGRPTRVTNIIVPVYPKVRIAYKDIENIVTGLDAILSVFFNTRIRYDLVWDIKLMLSETFKSNIRSSPLPDKEKIALITTSMPKYLWLCTCYIGDTPVFLFTFDATDVVNGMIMMHFVSYSSIFLKDLLQHLVENREEQQDKLNNKASRRYYEFLIEKLAAAERNIQRIDGEAS